MGWVVVRVWARLSAEVNAEEAIAVAVVRAIPSRAEQLALEGSVAPEARAGLRAGADLFDAGRFWDAHERWEGVWQAEPRLIRSFYQGLIQIAAGYHQWAVKHRPRGGALNLGKGIRTLGEYRPGYLGVDVAAMLADAERMRTLAARHDAAGLAAFPAARFPRFRWLASGS